MNWRLPGSSARGIIQARILEWVAMTSSKGSSQPKDQTSISCGSCITGRFFTTEPPRKPRYSKQQNRPKKKKSLFFWDLLDIWRRQKIIQPLRKLCSILVYERGYVKKKISRERDILGNIILNRKVWEELTKKYSWCKFQRGLWENSGDS